jgi:predicted transglutaminase-like cysteine proteinase
MKKFDLIKKVNSDVNKSTKYKSDTTLYEELEYWNPVSSSPSGHEGDCEDYALEKRKRLLETGEFEMDEVRLATCWVEGPDGTPGEGGYHAVLAVVLDDCDYVLDNRYEDVMPWGELPYRWDRILINGIWRKVRNA